jgi:hypothetical protein
MSNVELKDEDVQQIIDTLIYDGKVDKVKDAAISIPVRPSHVVPSLRQIQDRARHPHLHGLP